MNTQATPTTEADSGIPAFLDDTKRTTKPVTVAKSATPAKEPKPAKQAKTPKPKKGKVVAAAHKPSTVEATEQNPQKSLVPVRFKAKYAATGDSCGDRVAAALKKATTTKNADGRDACDVAALKAIAEQNGIDFSAYAKLNVGQQRMNVGNRLRGMLKNEQAVTIGSQRFADWEKAKLVDAKAWEKPEPKAKAEKAAA